MRGSSSSQLSKVNLKTSSSNQTATSQMKKSLKYMPCASTSSSLQLSQSQLQQTTQPEDIIINLVKGVAKSNMDSMCSLNSDLKSVQSNLMKIQDLENINPAENVPTTDKFKEAYIKSQAKLRASDLKVKQISQECQMYKEENKLLKLEVQQMKGSLIKTNQLKEQSILMNSANMSYLGRDKGIQSEVSDVKEMYDIREISEQLSEHISLYCKELQFQHFNQLNQMCSGLTHKIESFLNHRNNTLSEPDKEIQFLRSEILSKNIENKEMHAKLQQIQQDKQTFIELKQHCSSSSSSSSSEVPETQDIDLEITELQDTLLNALNLSRIQKE